MKIGFIGLGIMGKPMAKNLLKAGYTDLLVNNRSQAPVQELEAAGTIEYKLLTVLARNVGKVLTHSYIMERVWGWDSDAGINVVWVHISNLRKRLKAIGMTIQANRGLGYILEAER